ncbi:MAG: PEP/pyruvate-binding domain-containing protein [Patescibacteria group bacterium]
MIYIKTFNQINKSNVKEVGGKGASLGEMIKAGIQIPPGFVVTAQVHRKFMNDSLPADVEEEILTALDALGAQRVAVRSSAIAEDSSQASWAGQLETYLNVSRDNLINKIRECWNSIKSERALAYAGGQNLSEEDLFVAVVVQKMVESKTSGVMFTVNPITKDTNEIMIEAGFGLGELLVQGLITPDNFIVNKHTLEIKNRDIQSQDTMLVFRNGENKEISVPEGKKNEQTVSDKIIKELAEIGKKIEVHYAKPQDIEWAIDSQSKIWILQSRPITTL